MNFSATFRPPSVSAPASPGSGEPALDRLLIASIMASLAVQAWLALRMEINWDEFYYMSQIYDYQRGQLATGPQTIHVHLFGWLTRLPGSEIAQVQAGRMVMLACEAISCSLIYALARTWFGRCASLIAVLAYVTAGFTMIHGASFRTDPLAAMLTLAALVMLARAPMNFAAACGFAAASALAALVTVKVVFYAPAFAGLAAWRWFHAADRGKAVRWLAASAVSAALLAAAIYWAHLAALAGSTGAGPRSMIGGAARTALLDAGLLPRAQEILRCILLSPVQSLLIVIGGVAAVADLRQPDRARRARAAVVLASAAPLLCLLFYRNAFPYFFAFLLPSAALLIARAFDAAAVRKYSLLVAAGLSVPAGVVAAEWSSHDQRSQAELLRAVHQAFPRPVPYIDRNGMIASFPKRGFFMSTWGMTTYRRDGAVFRKLLEGESIPLLIVNGPALEQALENAPATGLPLLPEDRRVLLENYIPHWGRMWVAGKRLRVGPEITETVLAIPGTYTVEGAPAQIDGRTVPEGGVVRLARGNHQLRAAEPASVTLRWGDHLARPGHAPPETPIYRGF